MKQHLPFFGALATFAIVAVGAAPHGIVGAAQSPTAETAPISQVLFGHGTSAVAPDRDLILQQRTFAPGSDSGPHPAAGPAVLYVDSGEVEFTVAEGAALLSRQGASEQEPVVSGASVDLYRGDAVFYDQGVVHDVANSSAAPAVTLEARLNPVEQIATPTS